MPKENGIEMSNPTGSDVVTPEDRATQPLTRGQRALPFILIPRRFRPLVVVFIVFVCFTTYVNVSIVLADIHKSSNPVPFHIVNKPISVSSVLEVYIYPFRTALRKTSQGESLGCMLSKAGRFQVYKATNNVYTMFNKPLPSHAHESTALDSLNDKVMTYLSHDLLEMTAQYGHRDPGSLSRSSEVSDEENKFHTCDIDLEDIQIVPDSRLDRKKFLPGFYLIPDTSFPAKDTGGYSCPTSSCRSQGASNSISSNTCEESISLSMDHSKLPQIDIIHASDIEQGTRDKVHVNKMPERRSIANPDWIRMEKEECIATVCNVDLGYCSGSQGSLTNSEKKICKMCAPRTDALILQHCQSKVKREVTGMWTLVAMAVLVLLVGLGVVFRKQYRGRPVRNVICEEGTELRVVPLRPPTCNTDMPTETATPRPWQKRFWLPSRRATFPVREIPSSTDGQQQQLRPPSRWYHRFRSQPLPNAITDITQGVSRLERRRLEGERSSQHSN